MIKIGITGGLGSGKSVVARLLALQGIPVYIADDESKRLTATSPLLRKQLCALFGDTLYAGGQLDKQRLAALIFHDADNLRRVNALIHPAVGNDFLAWAERQTSPYCAIESAILFESGFDRLVDTTLMVYAPLEVRLQRALLRDGTTRDALLARIRQQLPDEAKREASDYTLLNDGTHPLLPQIEAYLAFLQERGYIFSGRS